MGDIPKNINEKFPDVRLIDIEVLNKEGRHFVAKPLQYLHDRIAEGQFHFRIHQRYQGGDELRGWRKLAKPLYALLAHPPTLVG